MREHYDKIINNINALVNISVSDLPHEQQPGPSTSGDTSELQRIEYDSDTSTSDSDSGSDSDTSLGIAPTQPEKKHWTVMVQLYKCFSFTRETKKHINLQETVYRPARVIELVSLLKMKKHVIITVSDTREEKFEE